LTNNIGEITGWEEQVQLKEGPGGAGPIPFLVVRDHFYENPENVRRVAQSMKFIKHSDVTGYSTDDVYHERDIRGRLEQILGVKITRWDRGDGNGCFYEAYARGNRKEVPGIHCDEPYDDITALVYLTPDLPSVYGTSLWQHISTGLIAAPNRTDAYRLGTTLTKLRDRLERDSENRRLWTEIDRAGYRYNRLVAYPSGLLHSATRHYGSNLQNGRLYQTFRIGVDWRTCKLCR
jgi:Family of unknown function (DUF6445)